MPTEIVWLWIMKTQTFGRKQPWHWMTKTTKMLWRLRAAGTDNMSATHTHTHTLTHTSTHTHLHTHTSTHTHAHTHSLTHTLAHSHTHTHTHTHTHKCIALFLAQFLILSQSLPSTTVTNRPKKNIVYANTRTLYKGACKWENKIINLVE